MISDVPQKFGDIVQKALEKDRDLRYTYAAEMQTDLQRLKRELEAGAAAPLAAEIGPREASELQATTVTPTDESPPASPVLAMTCGSMAFSARRRSISCWTSTVVRPAAGTRPANGTLSPPSRPTTCSGIVTLREPAETWSVGDVRTGLRPRLPRSKPRAYRRSRSSAPPACHISPTGSKLPLTRPPRTARRPVSGNMACRRRERSGSAIWAPIWKPRAEACSGRHQPTMSRPAREASRFEQVVGRDGGISVPFAGQSPGGGTDDGRSPREWSGALPRRPSSRRSLQERAMLAGSHRGRDCRCWRLAGFSWPDLGRQWRCGSSLQFALQSLQVGLDFSGVGVAQIAVLFQRLLDDGAQTSEGRRK